LGEKSDKVLNDLMTYFTKHYEFPEGSRNFETELRKLI